MCTSLANKSELRENCKLREQNLSENIKNLAEEIVKINREISDNQSKFKKIQERRNERLTGFFYKIKQLIDVVYRA